MKKLLVLFAAVALVAAFALPAAAATVEEAVEEHEAGDSHSWGFYGSARVGTWYTGDSDKIADVDTDNFDLDLQGNSRIGANVKHGAIGGRFEYGTGVNVRLLYGTWDFGGGEFLVGQAYTPLNRFPSNQVFDGDADLLPYGGIYNGRVPMLQLKMAGFKIALMEANTGDPVVGQTGEEHTFPKLEAAYNMTAGPAALKFMAGWQKYTVDPNDADESAMSYFLGIGSTFNFGAITLSADGWYGSNIGQYGLWHNTFDDAILVGEGDAASVEDTKSFGLLGVFNFKATDMWAFELGAGYTESDNDTFIGKDDELALYGNAVWTLAPGFFIVPEIGWVDYGDNSLGLDQGDMVYAGAKFQINF